MNRIICVEGCSPIHQYIRLLAEFFCLNLVHPNNTNTHIRSRNLVIQCTFRYKKLGEKYLQLTKFLQVTVITMILYSTIMWQRGGYWRIDSHLTILYLPIFPLPLKYSIGAYFYNFMLKQVLELSGCCYICPLK